MSLLSAIGDIRVAAMVFGLVLITVYMLYLGYTKMQSKDPRVNKSAWLFILGAVGIAVVGYFIIDFWTRHTTILGATTVAGAVM